VDVLDVTPMIGDASAIEERSKMLGLQVIKSYSDAESPSKVLTMAVAVMTWQW
jgi:hypothetical protein